MTEDAAALCLLAGGRGTRLGERARDTPKPLVPVAGRPFIEYLLEEYARQGLSEVWLLVGHRGDAFRPLLGDGERFGLRLHYRADGPRALGTAGAVRQVLPELPQRFLVTYADTFLRVDYRALLRAAAAAALPGMMAVLRNDGRWDRSNCAVADGRVLRYDKAAADGTMAYIDYGVSVLHRGVFADIAPGAPADLAGVLGRLAHAGELGAYEVHERFYEIGTPAALAETEQALPAILDGLREEHGR